MSLKDIVNNVKDSITEIGHKSAAEGEQTKRDVAGDQMTVGENLTSMVNQGVETVKGETSAAKVEARKEI